MSGRKKKKLKHIMLTLKSTFDSIGTAAGVAWPLFGIVSTSLSFEVGGLATFGLGSICSIIFLTVSIPLFFITLQNNKKKKMQLMHKLTIIDTTIHLLQENYLKEKNDSIADFKDYLLRLQEQLSENNQEKISLSLIKFLLTQDSLFLTDNQFTQNKKQIKRFRQAFICQAPTTPSLQHLITTFCLNFAGAFGSIAGCSSGFMGLLVGLGIVSGFNVVFGLGVLTAAIVIGLGMAIRSVQVEREEMRKKEVYKSIKVFHQEISKHPSVLPKKMGNETMQRPNSLHRRNRVNSNLLPNSHNTIPLSLFYEQDSKNRTFTKEKQSLLHSSNSHEHRP